MMSASSHLVPPLVNPTSGVPSPIDSQPAHESQGLHPSPSPSPPSEPLLLIPATADEATRRSAASNVRARDLKLLCEHYFGVQAARPLTSKARMEDALIEHGVPIPTREYAEHHWKTIHTQHLVAEHKHEEDREQHLAVDMDDGDGTPSVDSTGLEQRMQHMFQLGLAEMRKEMGAVVKKAFKTHTAHVRIADPPMQHALTSARSLQSTLQALPTAPSTPSKRAGHYPAENVRQAARDAGAGVDSRSPQALRPSRGPLHSVHSILHSSIPVVDSGDDSPGEKEDSDSASDASVPSRRIAADTDALVHVYVCDEFLRAHPPGTLPSYVDRHNFKQDRNRRECAAVGNFIELVRTGTSRRKVLESLARRLMGVMQGDETGNWNYCDALDISAHQRSAVSYLSQGAMSKLYKQARLLEKVQQGSGTSSRPSKRRAHFGTGASATANNSTPLVKPAATSTPGSSGRGKK
jgi:hypothetical protein